MATATRILLLAALLALALPASALAATRCVPALVAGCDSNHASPQAAADAASPGDTVRIAAGTWGPIGVNKPLTVVGAGAGTLDSATGATVLQGGASTPGLELASGGTARTLRASGGNGVGAGDPGGHGVALTTGASGISLTLDRVIGVGGNAGAAGSAGAGVFYQGSVSPPAPELRVSGGAFKPGVPGAAQSGAGVLMNTNGSASLRGFTATGAGIFGAGVQTGGSVRADVEGATLSGPYGAIFMGGTATLRRSRSLGTTGGAFVWGFPGSVAATVESSLLRTDGTASAAFVQAGGGGGTTTFASRGSTFVADGPAEGALSATRLDTGTALTAGLRNTIVRHRNPSPGARADLLADRAALTASASSFSTRIERNGGTAPAPGSGTNMGGDPRLTTAFSLPASSPLIDRGEIIFAPGALDLAGAPRSLDGNRDCVARPDIGAFELTGRSTACPRTRTPAANARPSVTRFGMTTRVFAPKAGASQRRRRVKRSTRFFYRLSEAAAVSIRIERRSRGRRVKDRCVKRTRRNRKRRRCNRFRRVGTLRQQGEAGANSRSFSGRLRGKPLKRGRYRATIVATDAQGLRSKRRRTTFRIVKP